MSNSEIAGILVKLKVDNDTYNRQLKKTEARTKQSSQKMSNSFQSLKGVLLKLIPVLGTIAISSKVISSFKEFRVEVDRIQKIGLKLGESTENLSRLKFIAEQSGIAFNSLTSALTKMNRKVTEASMGTGEAVIALQKLGIVADELQNKSPYEQFMTIAQAISLIDNASEKIYILDKLFGGAGTTLQQAFSGGYEALQKLANATPNVITQETADRVAEFNDNMHKLGENIKKVTYPMFTALAKKINEVFSIFEDKSELEKAQLGVQAYANSINAAKDRIKELQKELTYFSVFEMKTITRESVKKEIEAQERIIKLAEKQQQQLEEKIKSLTKQKDIIDDTDYTEDEIEYAQFTNQVKQLEQAVNLLNQSETKDYLKKIKNLENEIKELESQVFSTSEKIKQYMIDSTDTWSDNLTDAILSGKDSFKSLGEFAKNILDDIGRQLLKYNITQPLVKAGVSYFSDDFVGQVKQGINKGADLLSSIPGISNKMVSPSLRVEQNITITSGAEVSEIDKKISQQVPGIVEAAKAGVIEATRNNPVFRR